jgi:hypothetical protein
MTLSKIEKESEPDMKLRKREDPKKTPFWMNASRYMMMELIQ